MAIDLREVRVRNEWEVLRQVALLNPSFVEILDCRSAPEEDLFRVTLHQACGIVQVGATREFVFSHTAEICFARFFPSVPIEVHLATPIFHPNIDPANGFVCLWSKFSPGDTVLEVLYRLQHIISWNLVNLEGAHVMQREAAKWYEDPSRQTALPLSCTPLRWPEQFSPQCPVAESHSTKLRTRLEPVAQ